MTGPASIGGEELSQKTAKLLVFTLVRRTSKRWRRLKGADQLRLVINGIKFADGVAVYDAETRAAWSGRVTQIQP